MFLNKKPRLLLCLFSLITLNGCLSTVPAKKETNELLNREHIVLIGSSNISSKKSLERKNLVEPLNISEYELASKKDLLSFFRVGNYQRYNVKYDNKTKNKYIVLNNVKINESEFSFSKVVCKATTYNVEKRNCDYDKQAVTSAEGSMKQYRETVFSGSVSEQVSSDNIKITFIPTNKTTIYTVNSIDNTLEELRNYKMSEYEVYKKFDRTISMSASYQSNYEPDATFTQMKSNFEKLNFYYYESSDKATGTFQGYRVGVVSKVEPFRNGSLVTYIITYPSIRVTDIKNSYVYDVSKVVSNAEKLVNIIGMLD